MSGLRLVRSRRCVGDVSDARLDAEAALAAERSHSGAGGDSDASGLTWLEEAEITAAECAFWKREAARRRRAPLRIVSGS